MRNFLLVLVVAVLYACSVEKVDEKYMNVQVYPTNVIGILPEEDDSFEPNDSLSDAVLLDVSNGSVVYTNASFFDDDDFFKLNVPDGNMLVSRIEFNHFVADLDLFLIDSNGDTLKASASRLSSAEVVSQFFTNARTVFLEVEHHAGTNVYYTLRVSETNLVPSSDDSFEDNDSSAQSTSLTPPAYYHLSAFPSDPDYFSVSVDGGCLLNAFVKYSPEPAPLHLYLISSSSTLSSKTGRGTEEVSKVFQSSETAYLMVSNAGSLAVGYNLSVSVQKVVPSSDDNLEDNDSFSSAVELKEGKHTNLAVFFDDDDFYKVKVSSNDTITVSLTTYLDDADVRITLYDESESELDTDTTSGGSAGVKADVEYDGFVFVKVEDLSSEAVYYDLNISVGSELDFMSCCGE